MKSPSENLRSRKTLLLLVAFLWLRFSHFRRSESGWLIIGSIVIGSISELHSDANRVAAEKILKQFGYRIETHVLALPDTPLKLDRD